MPAALSEVWELLAVPFCIFQSWEGDSGMTFILQSPGNSTALGASSSAKSQDTCGNLKKKKKKRKKGSSFGFLCILEFLVWLWSPTARLIFFSPQLSWYLCPGSDQIIWVHCQFGFCVSYLFGLVSKRDVPSITWSLMLCIFIIS